MSFHIYNVFLSVRLTSYWPVGITTVFYLNCHALCFDGRNFFHFQWIYSFGLSQFRRFCGHRNNRQQMSQILRPTRIRSLVSEHVTIVDKLLLNASQRNSLLHKETPLVNTQTTEGLFALEKKRTQLENVFFYRFSRRIAFARCDTKTT